MTRKIRKEESQFIQIIESLHEHLNRLSDCVKELPQSPQQAEFFSQTFTQLQTYLTDLQVTQQNFSCESTLKSRSENLEVADNELAILQKATLPKIEQLSEDVTPKQQMEATLQYRVAFERLLTQISTQFINLTSKEIDQGINQALKAIGKFTFVDRIYIYSSDGKQISLTHDWCAKGLLSSFNNKPEIPKDAFLWISTQLRQFKTVYIPCVEELPEVAEAERLSLKSLGVKTFVAVPLVYDSVLIGTLCFSSLICEKVWSEEDITLLSTLGDIFANALARKYVESAIRESEERFRQLAENIDDIFWIYCLENKRLLYVSPAYKNIFGCSYKNVYENAFIWLNFVHPDDRKLASIEAWYREENSKLEYRIVRPDGEIHWICDRAFPIRNEQGIVYRYAGIAEDISERKLAFEQLQASLKDKEVLLQEIHHRVKNNLQIISSLLYLQANRIKDEQARDFLQDSRNRIESMALVHESLYRKSNFSGINFAEYIQNLAANLFNLYKSASSNISLRVNVSSDILIDLEEAIPCGLIINELITNALKHSFKHSQEGEVFVSLETNIHQQLVLTVGNNGDCLPNDFELERTQSMGLKLVLTLVRQLQGTIELERQGLIVFKIIFPNSG